MATDNFEADSDKYRSDLRHLATIISMVVNEVAYNVRAWRSADSSILSARNLCLKNYLKA